MRGNWLLLSLLIIGCKNDDIPSSLYDYQVERLLSNGDSKLWVQVIIDASCNEPNQLKIELIESGSNDSLAISRLVSNSDCSGVNEIFVGNADASSFLGSLRFSDSLLFANNSYWILNHITSRSLEISINNKTISYTSE